MSQPPSKLPNWTGLLDWSTRFHDGTSASNLGPMDPERKEWLQKALNASFEGGEDPNETLKNAVTEIGKENVDKLGGLEALLGLVSTDDERICRRALEVLSLYLPNNPRIQLSAALKHGALDVFKRCVATHAGNLQIVQTVLSGVGSLIRGVTPLEKSFIRDGGIDYLCSIPPVTSGIAMKICSILFSLRIHTSLDTEVVHGFLTAIYGNTNLGQDDIQLWENAASVALAAKPLPESLRSLILKRKIFIRGNMDFVTENELLESI